MEVVTRSKKGTSRNFFVTVESRNVYFLNRHHDTDTNKRPEEKKVDKNVVFSNE